MLIHLNTQTDLEAAILALVKQDPRLKPVFEIAGMPALRRREPGFAGLAAHRLRPAIVHRERRGDLGARQRRVRSV